MIVSAIVRIAIGTVVLMGIYSGIVALGAGLAFLPEYALTIAFIAIIGMMFLAMAIAFVLLSYLVGDFVVEEYWEAKSK